MTFWEREKQAAEELALPIFLVPLIIVTVKRIWRKAKGQL